MTARYDAVMFDLDGTLADTLADIAAAANHALARLGHEPIDTQRYRYLAGQGLAWLMTHALGGALADQAEQGMALFRAYYADHYMDRTRPYEGVPELLDELTGRGLSLAVLSNKPHAATCAVIERIFARWRFDAVRGDTGQAPLKPDPASALAIAAELGVPPGRWLYVGDTKVDMQTATAAGMLPVGVLWGFRDEAELRGSGAQAIIRQPAELTGLL